MSERRVTVKSESDLPDLGVNISFQVVDKKVEAIVIGEGADAIRIAKAGTYSEDLKVTKLDPGEQVDKWFVTGKLLGLTDYEEGPFDDQWQASEHITKIVQDKCISGDSGLDTEKRVITVYSDKI